MKQWLNDSVRQWVNESMKQRITESMTQWWTMHCLNEPRKHRTNEPKQQWITEVRNFPTSILQNSSRPFILFRFWNANRTLTAVSCVFWKCNRPEMCWAQFFILNREKNHIPSEFRPRYARFIFQTIWSLEFFPKASPRLGFLFRFLCFASGARWKWRQREPKGNREK